jgi:hypothetical protein
MVVRYVTKNGSIFHGPPYTKAEIREMHRRMQDGPRAMTMTGRFGVAKGQPTTGVASDAPIKADQETSSVRR